MNPAAHPPRLAHLLWLPSLVLLAACDPIWQSAGRVVRCEDKSPLEGVSVTLAIGGASQSFRTEKGVTDASGSFFVQRIASHGDPAKLTLEKPGYVTLTHEYRRAPSLDDRLELCLNPSARD